MLDQKNLTQSKKAMEMQISLKKQEVKESAQALASDVAEVQNRIKNGKNISDLTSDMKIKSAEMDKTNAELVTLVQMYNMIF